MPVTTKICGLTTKEAVDVAIACGAGYLGFVFFPNSPRNITPADAAAISSHVPAHIKKVAVTVSMSDAEFDALLAEFTPDYIQMHGDEWPERLQEVKLLYHIPIIKAIAVSSEEDIPTAALYEEHADMLLFDAKPPKDALLPGGNGISFDWNILSNKEFSRPWFLSGGLSCNNITSAIERSHATMVDVSSGVESSPGIKDLALIKKFLSLTKKHDCT